MKLTKGKKIAIGAVLFGSVMLWQSLQIKPLFPPTEGDCGPGFFPAFCCVGLILCAVGKFFFPVIDEKEGAFLDRKGWLKAALMVAWLAGYVLALTWFGFIIATIPAFFLLILLFTWKEKKNYVAAAVYAVVYAVGAYFLFTRVLNVILPTGKLF